MVVAVCPRCTESVALHVGKPVVTATGVALWHLACWDVRDQPIASTRPSTEDSSACELIVPPPARRRRLPWLVGAGAVAALGLGALGFAFARGGADDAPTTFARADVAIGEAASVHAAVTANEQRPLRTWVATAMEARYPMPVDEHAVPLDDRFPSLRGWIHPVSKSKEHVPTETPRLFGVGRAGIEHARPECGEGHCGIDLDGPRGRPLVAVADGHVVRVERSELGADHLSGRYVRVQHDDGTYTAYMHMDDVAEQLEPGSRVTAGQYLGTLGATAVYVAPPHLHFSLEIPAHPGRPFVGDGTDTIFVDPAPFLARARIIPRPTDLDDVIEKPDDDAKGSRTKRHPIKPPT